MLPERRIVAFCERPLQCRTKVCDLRLHEREERTVGHVPGAGIARHGQFREICREAPHTGVVGAAFAQAVERVRTQRFKKPVTRFARAVFDHRHERLGHQRLQRRAAAGRILRRADGDGRLQRKASGEETQARKELTLRRSEERVAPIDHGAQRMMAPVGRSLPSPQQRKAFVEAGDNVRQRQIARACSGELERERKPIETLADPRRQHAVLRAQLAVAPVIGVDETIDEQSERRALRGGIGIGEGLHMHDPFAFDPEGWLLPPRKSAKGRSKIASLVVNDRAFGDLLRELRCAAGLSQEALAERARLSPGAISSLERSARRGPQQATLSLLSDALRLDASQRAQLEQAATAGRRRGVRMSTLASAGAPSPRHNLPYSPTSFHGHETDLAQLEGLIAVRRLITLLGSGGVGKTRLALELAHRLVEKNEFPDGVWLVELAPLGSPGLVASAMARVLSVSERANEPITVTLARAIGSKRLVIVLDNCEHVLDECARIAEALVGSCPGIVLIATTREALRIDGECLFRVAPLPTEFREATGTALDLLLDRLIDADFTRFAQISADDRALAATICRRLDGLPLALELAAGRARDLSLETIVTGLDERFSLLGGGRRRAGPRQHTLRSALDWSYELLTAGERESFARLGLFAAPFTLDAAAEICANDARTFRETLAALVAKSLVAIVEEDDGRLRYRLLETMRAFALDRLRASGKYDSCARRFAEYYCARAKAADVSHRRVGGREFFALVGAEIDNFRAALEWALGQRNDILLGAELAGALGWAYQQTALSREGARWAERALAEAPNAEPAVIGRLVMALHHFYFQFGQLKDAYDAAIRAAALYQTVDRQSDVCWALTRQVYCLYLLGRADEARTVGEQAVAVARAQRDAFRLADALSAYAQIIPIERAPERFAALEDAIRAYRDAGDTDAMVPTACLAETHYATGNYAAALACGLQVLAIIREKRDRSNLAGTLVNVAAYALGVEDDGQAHRAACEALELLAGGGETRVAMHCLEHLSSVAARRNSYVRAARLAGASNRLYRVFGLERQFTEQSLYDRTLAQITAGIGMTATRQNLDNGAALSIEAAIAEALEPAESTEASRA